MEIWWGIRRPRSRTSRAAPAAIKSFTHTSPVIRAFWERSIAAAPTASLQTIVRCCRYGYDIRKVGERGESRSQPSALAFSVSLVSNNSDPPVPQAIEVFRNSSHAAAIVKPDISSRTAAIRAVERDSRNSRLRAYCPSNSGAHRERTVAMPATFSLIIERIPASRRSLR